MKNIGLKFWSLLIALCIAYAVNNHSATGVVTLVVPVELRNLPEKKIVLSPRTFQVKLTLRAPSFELTDLLADPPKFTVDVGEMVDDRFEVSLQASQLSLPNQVEVVTIDPPTMEVVLDDLVTRTLPVIVPRIGQVKKNLKLESITLNPATVSLSGPATELQGLARVETTPLDLRGLEQSTEMRLALRLPGIDTKSDREVIDVSITISRVQSERTFSGLPIELRSALSTSVAYSPTKVTVEVTGPIDVVKKLKSSSILPYIRIEQEFLGSRQVTVGVDLPDEVSLVQVEPEKVEAIAGKK